MTSPIFSPSAPVPSSWAPAGGWYVAGQQSSQGGGASSGAGNSFNNPQYTQWLNDQAEEQRRQADQAYGLQKRQLDQTYSIAKRNAKTAAERNAIDKWYQQQQVKLAQDRLAEEHRQFDATHSLAQGRLSYDLANMAAQLHGAKNPFQVSELARNVSTMPQTATFLQALKNNTNLAGFGAQGGSPDALTLQSLVSELTGGMNAAPGAAPTASAGASTPGVGAPGSESANIASNLAAIHGIGAAGAHRLGAGTLEQLSPGEQSLLMKGLEAPDPQGKAFDAETFLDQWRRSRIGQSIGGANFRAA